MLFACILHGIQLGLQLHLLPPRLPGFLCRLSLCLTEPRILCLHQARYLFLVGHVQLRHLALPLMQLLTQARNGLFKSLHGLLHLTLCDLLLQAGCLAERLHLVPQHGPLAVGLDQLRILLLICTLCLIQLLEQEPVFAAQALHHAAHLHLLSLHILAFALHLKGCCFFLNDCSLLLSPHVLDLVLELHDQKGLVVVLTVQSMQLCFQRHDLLLWLA
mmetsp:Transcript_27255/g.73646  ORF Transcript_27255/g.73646 Transcript_27255/m.73646 type:complete len:217 (-) Transcript_27255:677-1327(-)